MSVDNLTTVICWLAVIWGAFRTDLRSRQAAYSFLTFVCITLVATFRNPTVAYAIDRVTALPDLGRMLSYLATTGTATFWALVCLGLAPAAIQRRRWLVALAPMVVIALLGFWWLEVIGGQPVQAYVYRTNNYSVAMTIFAQAYLFTTLIGITLPTLIVSARAEANPALRLRLILLTSSQVFAAIMTGVVLGIHLLIIRDQLPRDFESPAVPFFMALTAGAYVISILPAALYTQLVLVIRHLRQIKRIGPIRQLEQHTAHLLGFAPRPVHFSDILEAPDHTLYQLIISILDRRKSLRVNPHPAAQAMADYLDNLHLQAPGYPELVREFHRIGRQL